MSLESRTLTPSGGRYPVDIIKVAPIEKWKTIINFQNKNLALEFQKASYTKCLEMRSAYGVVKFTDPYIGEAYLPKRNAPQKKYSLC